MDHTHHHAHLHDGNTEQHNCDHVHSHSHEHAHTHDDGQTHTHDHNHAHMHIGEPGEIKALLVYMLHHNVHHTEELQDLVDSLPENAREKMRIAIASFKVANDNLKAVLDCLE